MVAILSNINSASNFIRNPFNPSVNNPFQGPDFDGGFLIEEILSTGNQGERIRLVGNLMPHNKVPFGGSQRMKKEFYSGYAEPVMQIFGPEESDIVIMGEFKDKKYSNQELKGVATEIANLIDGIRIRGNIVKIQMGELQRYGIISKTEFDLERITRVPYKITFSIIGFNSPKNAKFLQRNKEFPFAVNKSLIDEAINFQDASSAIPDSVPQSIGDIINGLTSDVAGAIATVTGFVDQILTTVEDVQKSVNRVQGLIKHCQNKLANYKRVIGGFNSFDIDTPIANKYESSAFYSARISQAASMTALLQRLRAQMVAAGSLLPLGRHFVRQSDTLQKISTKFYGTPDNWKKIYDYNNLSSTELTNGTLLNVPRV